VKEAAKAWQADRAASMGAALAYYTAFSIAPLLIVVVAVAGLVFGRDAAQAALIDQLQNLIGHRRRRRDQRHAEERERALARAFLAIVIGVSTLLVAATTCVRRIAGRPRPDLESRTSRWQRDIEPAEVAAAVLCDGALHRLPA
jgi:uncharacterized BrkB/YihY/UPF0761 family membrane protein